MAYPHRSVDTAQAHLGGTRPWRPPLTHLGYISTMTDRTKADRMRRYRQRKRRGLTCLMVWLNKVEIDRLVKAKYLDEDQTGDQMALQEAATAFVSDAFFSMVV